MKWDARRLLRAVEGTHGNEVSMELRNCIDSVSRRFEHVDYHCAESIRLFEAAIRANTLVPENVASEIATGMSLVLNSTQHSTSREFRETIRNSEANLIASAHAIHSTADVVAHAVFYSLNLSSRAEAVAGNSLSTNNLSIKKLKSKPFSNCLAEELSSSVKVYLDTEEFKYLDAFVNTIKHRSLVGIEPRAVLGEPSRNKYGLVIGAFEYRSRSYLKKWSEDFFTADMGTLKCRLVDICRALELQVLGR